MVCDASYYILIADLPISPNHVRTGVKAETAFRLLPVSGYGSETSDPELSSVRDIRFA